MTSDHGASGPGSVRSSPRLATAITGTNGASATANAYGATADTPSAARATHAPMRTMPSAPMTTAYERNRLDPEQTPRARCAGAYTTNAVASAATIHQFPSK